MREIVKSIVVEYLEIYMLVESRNRNNTYNTYNNTNNNMKVSDGVIYESMTS